ncbi:hypothetical protein H0O02_00505 [Candidatus Micrarchaeota archaeon]|nr:hypothetical protein [Candidatus Micrarchaeota archaeon]
MKKFIISGLVAGVVILVLWNVVGMLFGALLGFDVSALPGLRSYTDPIMTLYYLYPFVFGFALAYAYPFVEGKLKGDMVVKGFGFGILIFVINAIPSAFLNFTSMGYPFSFTVVSIIGPLVYLPAAGIAIAWVRQLK